jgi:hypothetical protein
MTESKVIRQNSLGEWGGSSGSGRNLGVSIPTLYRCCPPPNALAGGFFRFVKFVSIDRVKGAVNGRFTPKASQLASHPGQCAVGASASDG